VTAPDFDAAKDRAARELARRLEHVTTLQDPLTWARQFIEDMTAPGAWRYVPAPPAIKPAQPDPEATARGVAKAREALRKDEDHA
jgi:hypothetical protein